MLDDCDVLVIGGGLTGCAAALELARRGVPAILVERYDLNTQASGRNAGSLHGQIQHEPFLELGESWARSFAPALALLRDSLELWRGLGDELGEDLEVNLSGGLLVAASEAQLRAVERKATLERSLGSAVELLTREDLRRLAPYLSEHLVGGMLCALEGKANPLLAAPAVARAAVAAGARLRLQTEIRAVAPRAGGFDVETTGGRLRCGRIVDCAGTEIGRPAGVTLPAQRVPIQVAVTEAAPPLVSHLVYLAGERLTVKQAKVGSLLIGGGWPSRELADGRLLPELASLGPNLRLAIEVVPRLAASSLLRAWAGVCPGTPDQLPIVGEVAPGYVVAMFPYLGFTAAPLLGRIAVQLALGEDTGRDLAAFSPARF
jgi:glycine/D-amino acid oxidase-like deaminating enzyme